MLFSVYASGGGGGGDIPLGGPSAKRDYASDFISTRRPLAMPRKIYEALGFLALDLSFFVAAVVSFES